MPLLHSILEFASLIRHFLSYSVESFCFSRAYRPSRTVDLRGMLLNIKIGWCPLLTLSTRLLLDIFLSPFSQVTLSHVLVADFLTSLASPLRDLAICSCYLYRSLVDAEQVGISVAQNSCETLPLVALIPLVPALIRLLQCCRQIVLTHSVFPVINAIKYASVFPLVIFPLMEGFGALEAHELSPLFVARLANTSLSLVWDLTMDWGVFSSQSFLLDMDVAEEQVKRLPSYSYKNSQRRSTWPCLKFLRASSVFQPQSIIALIIVDFALRSFWVLGLLSLSLPAGLLLVLAQVGHSQRF